MTGLRNGIESTLMLKIMVMGLLVLQVSLASAERQDVRRIPVHEYIDKMKAGWIGQMVGVGWGGPTEFDWKVDIMPEQDLRTWNPEMVKLINVASGWSYEAGYWGKVEIVSE